MTNVNLSRRVGGVMAYPPLRRLSIIERLAVADEVDIAEDWADLSSDTQGLIEAAEAWLAAESEKQKHLPGRHSQASHGRGGGRAGFSTLDDNYRALALDTAAVDFLTEQGPGDTFEMAAELGADVDLTAFERLNSQWTQGADQDVKPDIAAALETNPTLRTLTLYDLFSNQNTEGGDFDEWLESPQTFHRGGGRSEPFMSFSTSARAAKDASGESRIATISAKPAVLLGSAMTGAGEVYIASEAIAIYETKHLPGRHSQASHGRGGGGGRSGKDPAKLPKSEAVWGGKQTGVGRSLSKFESGALGEEIAMHALSQEIGQPFTTLNVGMTNAPIDVAGNARAVEVKTGWASNPINNQRWRASIGQPGKAETAQLKLMGKEEKRAHNNRKKQAILARKQGLLDRLSAEAGSPIRGQTMGVILASDGKKADVFLFDGFHLSATWRNFATGDNYLGTYDITKIPSITVGR